MKKSAQHKANKKREATKPSAGEAMVVRAWTDGSLLGLSDENISRKPRHPQPIRINPESKEEREKRLAARKARTLKAFQITYENRRRKAS